ncbi:hypothetical protein DXG03_000198 [Asterophora parasitica]|uniref:Uncharacterized protein n=1 Tax=Asterophora parasitica TaxID=117018 RepID=A0A9P7GE40_9AGAR|nr:hypothetical protein DXG03_000198 [Asterophora parasitica]
MGNVIESSAESLPGAQEKKDTLASEYLHLNGESASRPPSRVLIRGEDSSNVWVALSTFAKGTTTETATAPDAVASILSVESPNTSLPLEAVIPATFDASFDPVELSTFFANPVANPDAVNLAENTRMPEVNVSTAIEGRVSQADDTDGYSKEPLSMVEEFSQLEGTMSELLSSPVPFFPPETTEPLARSSFEPKEFPALAKREPNVQISEPHELDDFAVAAAAVSRPSSPHLLPLPAAPIVLTTYADATNLAMQYPELAEEILTLPLPTPLDLSRKPTAIIPVVPRPPSPSLHHPDRPNWAAAPMPDGIKSPEELLASCSRTETGSRSPRPTDSWVEHVEPNQAAHHDASTSRPARADKLQRRHKPPPQRRGTEPPDRPPHLIIPLVQRLSDTWDPRCTAPEIDSDDTGTWETSQTQDWDCGPAHADMSSEVSSRRSDVYAGHEASTKD